MQNRTEGDKLIIDNFEGLNQSIDEVHTSNGLTPWSRGGYFDESGDFTRRKGKLLHSSDTTGGRVLAIAQLSFSDTDAVLIHRGPSYELITDLSALRVPDADVGSPLEPLIP